MSKKQPVDSNLHDLTDAEVYAAIRYLELQVGAPNDDVVAAMIGVAAAILSVAWLGLIWYCRY